MIRKSLIAIVTVATIAAASLAPASAKGFKHHGLGFGAGIFIAGLVASSCYQYRWVENRWGELVYRPVNVCRDW